MELGRGCCGSFQQEGSLREAMFQPTGEGARDVAQLGEILPSMHETLGSIHSTM